MTTEEILQIRDLAEHSIIQMKERLTRDNKYEVGCEMVALSNSRGGQIIIGIDDKTGRINPMSFMEIQEANNLLSNMASENVVPGILIETENVPVEGGAVVVVTVPRGKNRPYHDNKGIVWVKNGSDKRKVFDNSELAAMMMEDNHLRPDAIPVAGTSYKDLDEKELRAYFIKRFRSEFERKEIDIESLWHSSIEEIVSLIEEGKTPESVLCNLGLICDDGTLTFAALILMGTYPQKWLPVFTVRCVSFVGNSIGGMEFRDKSGGDADGNAVHLYKYIMTFLTRNLRHVQVEKDFNSLGVLEVSTSTLAEIVVNSILHRSYVDESPLRVFIFDNRIEIHSPGLLPSGIDIESIRRGVSKPRNSLLFNNGIYLLPYTGAGSGITRAIHDTPDIQFLNDESANEFVVTILRKSDSKSGSEYDNNETKSTNIVTNIITNIVGRKKSKMSHPENTLKKKDLTKVQKDIINFCSVPRSTREILDRIGVTYQSYNINKFIKPLEEAGFIEPTTQESNNPNRKYRKVRK